MTCPICSHPTSSRYRGVMHMECYKQQKRLEWKKADTTTKKEIEGEMKTLLLLERTFT